MSQKKTSGKRKKSKCLENVPPLLRTLQTSVYTGAVLAICGGIILEIAKILDIPTEIFDPFLSQDLGTLENSARMLAEGMAIGVMIGFLRDFLVNAKILNNQCGKESQEFCYMCALIKMKIRNFSEEITNGQSYDEKKKEGTQLLNLIKIAFAQLKDGIISVPKK